MRKKRILASILLGASLVTACQKDPVEPEQRELPKKEASTPEKDTPKEEPSKEETPKEEPPKEDPPKEEAPKPEPPKEDPPKEETPKPEPPKEDPPKQEPPQEEKEDKPEDYCAYFPQPDNSPELTGAPDERVLAILKSRKLDKVLPLGETHITKEQLAEIKHFTDSLMKAVDAKDEKDKHDTLFRWIRENVKYGYTVDPSIPDYNSAYSTFKYKNAICQGYSNLLKVFCYTQGMNAPIVNGMANFNTLGDALGHAWNYVSIEGKWYVSDPTNGGVYESGNKSKLNYLLPERLDFEVWEDDKMTYVYQKRELTVDKVKESFVGTQLTVPYSIGGLRISNFNPKSMPKSVRELYIGSNIKQLGTADHRELLQSGEMLEKIMIDPKNPYLETYKGCVYEKGNGSNVPLLIPAKLKRVRLKPIKTVGKNTIFNHNGVEELYFAEGTEVIEAYAIEGCHNLRVVYVPKSVKRVAHQAFYNCHPSLKVIEF